MNCLFCGKTESTHFLHNDDGSLQKDSYGRPIRVRCREKSIAAVRRCFSPYLNELSEKAPVNSPLLELISEKGVERSALILNHSFRDSMRHFKRVLTVAVLRYRRTHFRHTVVSVKNLRDQYHREEDYPELNNWSEYDLALLNLHEEANRTKNDEVSVSRMLERCDTLGVPVWIFAKDLTLGVHLFNNPDVDSSRLERLRKQIKGFRQCRIDESAALKPNAADEQDLSKLVMGSQRKLR